MRIDISDTDLQWLKTNNNILKYNKEKEKLIILQSPWHFAEISVVGLSKCHTAHTLTEITA